MTNHKAFTQAGVAQSDHLQIIILTRDVEVSLRFSATMKTTMMNITISTRRRVGTREQCQSMTGKTSVDNSNFGKVAHLVKMELRTLNKVPSNSSKSKYSMNSMIISISRGKQKKQE